jgi:hypothetical protein
LRRAADFCERHDVGSIVAINCDGGLQLGVDDLRRLAPDATSYDYDAFCHRYRFWSSSLDGMSICACDRILEPAVDLQQAVQTDSLLSELTTVGTP